MATYIGIGLLVALALLFLELLWDWRRSGRMLCRPIPAVYRDRGSLSEQWEQRCGHVGCVTFDAVLTLFCEAFSFNHDDRYKFGPDDRIMDVYRSLYPRWKLWRVADEMEIETFLLELDRQFGIEADRWWNDMSLGDVAEMIMMRRRAGSQHSL